MGDRRHRVRDARQKPPWWPADESWPPRSVAWRARGGRFLRRAILLFIGFQVLLFLGSVVGFVVFSGGDASDHRQWGSYGGPPVFGVVIIIGGAYLAYRMLKRRTAPVGDLMDATGRLVAGDFSVRVPVNGAEEMRDLAVAFNALAERLENNETRRRALIADVTHELRTPLSIIRGTAEGIADGVYPADEAHVGPIVEEAEIMARLLDDLGTLSTAEAGQLSLHLEESNARDLVLDSVAAFRARYEAAGIALTAAVANGLPVLNVDPLRVRQVLSNILANALHHTKPGGSVAVSADADDDRCVVFRVRDTGSGIPPDQVPHIFERFRKAGDSTGSGLGLAIARSLVEAHDGSIWADSVVGEGTTVSFSLPVSGPAA